MRRRHVSQFLCSVFCLALIAGACGRDGNGSAGARPDAATGAPAATSNVAFTAADLEAYERGFAREIELVRAAQDRQRTATTAQARGEAMQAQWEQQTMPEGARSAGLAPERYQAVRQTVNRVLQTLDFQGKIEGPMQLDTARATPEMRHQLTSDPLAELEPASAAALKARLDRLAPLWAQYMELTAVGG